MAAAGVTLAVVGSVLSHDCVVQVLVVHPRIMGANPRGRSVHVFPPSDSVGSSRSPAFCPRTWTLARPAEGTAPAWNIALKGQHLSLRPGSGFAGTGHMLALPSPCVNMLPWFCPGFKLRFGRQWFGVGLFALCPLLGASGWCGVFGTHRTFESHEPSPSDPSRSSSERSRGTLECQSRASLASVNMPRGRIAWSPCSGI